MTDLDGQLDEVARIAPVGAVGKLDLTQVVWSDAPLELIEADMVARLAAAAHKARRKFIGWPHFERRYGRSPDGIEEAVDVDPELGFVECAPGHPGVRLVELKASVVVIDRV